ncbi:MAG: response regulator transcription factor [Bacteroidetes bacterium]|nr:response regulator transcription factor [Bacteroidota bacterium]MBU1484076.1 response regulator transcription factor [Bacteroidota bacterium]MBU2046085.1 response regulator transcription factor [Bacteroidota bacterium]MBU2268448.1 response regulator transcription factor [Bacteroidota bacterium]MBU2376241.1 response regulator transcription factor [Bacteroidota bacterium]
MKILIVEDERELANSMVNYLQNEDYFCEAVADIDAAREKIGLFDYDCILLDIMLPKGSGLDLLEEIKKANKMDGVIIISAKNSVEDRIFSLKLGADDYLSKPFNLAELSARIQSIIRRRNFDGNNIIQYKNLVIDLNAKSVKVDDVEVEVTKSERALLIFLLLNKGKVVSKNSIAEHLSGQSAMYFDNFDIIYTHIKNLKKKLGNAGDYIKTIYGTGYKLV